MFTLFHTMNIYRIFLKDAHLMISVRLPDVSIAVTNILTSGSLFCHPATHRDAIPVICREIHRLFDYYGKLFTLDELENTLFVNKIPDLLQSFLNTMGLPVQYLNHIGLKAKNCF